MNDYEFLDHAQRLLDTDSAFTAAEAARLFRLGGETDIADVLANAAGLMPYFFPVTGRVLIASARETLAGKAH